MKKIILAVMVAITTLTSCGKEEFTTPENTQTENSVNKSDVRIPKTKIVYETISLQREQHFYLNSITHLGFNKKTRTYIPLEIPQNAIKVLYTATVSESKTPIGNLRLVAQLSSILLDPTGITTAFASKINVPEQGTSGRADFYLLDNEDISNFIEEKYFLYIGTGTRESLKSGVVEFGEETFNKFGRKLYIGIKNPRTITGQTITIEVAAIVKKEITTYDD